MMKLSIAAILSYSAVATSLGTQVQLEADLDYYDLD